ncbi:MAG: hypothetical protein FJY66_02130 [Calditrichaeota bacterium]|nr:hypothetical protein [Calditrichota bacterium]
MFTKDLNRALYLASNRDFRRILQLCWLLIRSLTDDFFLFLCLSLANLGVVLHLNPLMCCKCG